MTGVQTCALPISPVRPRLRAAGFTRVSLGMQSAAEHVLAVLDRRHTPGRAVEAAHEARAAGCLTFHQRRPPTWLCAPGPTPHQFALAQYSSLCRQRAPSPVAQLETSYQSNPAFRRVASAVSYRSARSEERRVGKECVRLCRSRWSPYH